VAPAHDAAIARPPDANQMLFAGHSDNLCRGGYGTLPKGLPPQRRTSLGWSVANSSHCSVAITGR